MTDDVESADRRQRAIGIVGYAFAAGFVVVLAWSILGQFVSGVVALRLTIYFSVLVGVSFGVVYGIGVRRGIERPKRPET